jgi:YegS/Rv2252/BmrU family lipid kinase
MVYQENHEELKTYDETESLAEDGIKVYVVYNPEAGSYDAALVREMLERYFASTHWDYTIYEITGQENMGELIGEAVNQGYRLFIAAGGDGTISSVASGLAHTGLVMGIIPAGTVNALARELTIPIDLEGALQLLVGEHTVKEIDALRVGEQFFLLQIGVGLSSLSMRETERNNIRRFGRLAYFWPGIRHLMNFQPQRFTLVVDDKRYRVRAAEVTVTNASNLRGSPFRWGPHIRPDDGQVEACIIRARTGLDYLRLAWNVLLYQESRDPNVRYLTVRQKIAIAVDEPLPVEGDGEIIGQTPVQIQVVPQALRVITPVEANLQQ